MRKYSLRLLTFSLLLGALPTVFIGIVSYYIASHDIESKVNEANMMLLTQTQMRVEQTLKSLEKSSTQFANSSLVKSAMNETLTAGDFPQVRNLTTELSNLHSSEAVILQAYLVNLEKDWAVSLNMLKKLTNLGNKLDFSNYAKQSESIFWNTGTSAVSGLEDALEAKAAFEETGAPTATISLVHKIPLLPQTSTPRGLLVVQISAADIRGVLAPNSELGRNYILDRRGADFLSSGAAQAGYSDINQTIMERTGDSMPKQGFFNSVIGESKVGVSYRISAYNGWTYVSVVSIADITKETKKIAMITAVVCALFLVVVFLLAFYGSRRMYLPIRNIVELTRNIESRPLDGTPKKDELEFIKESIQSLALSRNQMEQQVHGQAGHLKEFFVLKLFTGQMSEDDYLYRSQLYGFPTAWQSLGVLTLQIDNLQETRFHEQDRELLLFAVNNIVGEVLPAHSRFSPIQLNQSQVTLVTSDSEHAEEWKNDYYQAAEAVKQKVEQYLHIQVSIGISKPYLSLSDTVKAYGESLAALKSRINLGPDIIIHYEDIENNSDTSNHVYTHLKVMEEQLVQALREGQVDRAIEVFQRYLESVLHKDSYMHEHHILLLQLVTRMIQVVQDNGISVKKVLSGEGELERFLRLQTREEIMLWFQNRLFIPITNILSDKSDRQYVNIADKLVSMIHQQYASDITLESCSALMNFHPVYVSRVFKKEMGVTFSEYLFDYRMNMAKVMLETTDMKISEIGERLQYKNISAFIRGFRKMFGVTPGQYREQLDQKT